MRRTLAAAGILLLVLLALSQAPASAVFEPGPPPTDGGPAPAPQPPRENTSEMTMTGTEAGAGVDGWIGPTGSVSNPAVQYPPDPTALDGFTPHPEGFAGIIIGTPTAGGWTLRLYCIDILTLTYGGVGYNLGSWDESSVHNVGYVAYLLNNYYPNDLSQPPGLGVNQQAAAVQSAIWYFSDNYVLTAGDPLRPAVAAIVDDARLNGPLVAPDPPTLQITPPTAQASAGGLAGPFSIASPDGPATVAATDASMFSNAAGTVPVANGDTLPVGGGQLWLQSAAIGAAVLGATATASVPSGNVYLYSGNLLPGVTAAQRLILAQPTTLRTTVLAAAEFVADSGALIVTKTIDGPGAGSQGEVVITVSCGGTALVPDFVIPPGTTGSVTQRYDNLPTPATCTITETADGSNESVTVVTVNGSQTVTVPLDTVLGNAVEAQPITDTFETTTTVPTTTATTTTTTTTAPSTTTTGPTPTTTIAPTTAPTDPGSGAGAATAARLSGTGGHTWWPTALALGIGALAVGLLIVLLVRRFSPTA